MDVNRRIAEWMGWTYDPLAEIWRDKNNKWVVDRFLDSLNACQLLIPKIKELGLWGDFCNNLAHIMCAYDEDGEIEKAALIGYTAPEFCKAFEMLGVLDE